jgi:hypothetical protein
MLLPICDGYLLADHCITYPLIKGWGASKLLLECGKESLTQARRASMASGLNQQSAEQ